MLLLVVWCFVFWWCLLYAFLNAFWMAQQGCAQTQPNKIWKIWIILIGPGPCRLPHLSFAQLPTLWGVAAWHGEKWVYILLSSDSEQRGRRWKDKWLLGWAPKALTKPTMGHEVLWLKWHQILSSCVLWHRLRKWCRPARKKLRRAAVEFLHKKLCFYFSFREFVACRSLILAGKDPDRLLEGAETFPPWCNSVLELMIDIGVWRRPVFKGGGQRCVGKDDVGKDDEVPVVICKEMQRRRSCSFSSPKKWAAFLQQWHWCSSRTG